MWTAFIVILLLCFAVTLYSRWLRRVTCIHIIYTRLQTLARRSVDASTFIRKFHSQKRVVSGVDQMPCFENTKILCRDPYVLVNYSTTKIEIAFMLNLERPITATATASWPQNHCIGIFTSLSVAALFKLTVKHMQSTFEGGVHFKAAFF